MHDHLLVCLTLKIAHAFGPEMLKIEFLDYNTISLMIAIIFAIKRFPFANYIILLFRNFRILDSPEQLIFFILFTKSSALACNSNFFLQLHNAIQILMISHEY